MFALARWLSATLLCCLALLARGEPLRLVTEPWAPYVYEHDGQPTGLDYHTANEVFRRLGIEVRWEFLPWRRCLMMLEQNSADGVLDIFHTAQREALLVYPEQPLSTVQFVLLQANRRPHPATRLADLAGLTVGTQAAFAYGEAFNQASHFSREPGPTLEANLGKLMLGRVDLVITDRQAGRFAVQQLGLAGQVSELPLVVAEHPQYLALRRNAGLEQVMQRFDAELARYRQAPEYQALLQRFTDVSH